MKRKRANENDDSLGMDESITRKDFLNASLLGVGGALLGAPAPGTMFYQSRADSSAHGHAAPDAWTGYAGVGDYARGNGNTFPVLTAAHKIRDGSYNKLPANTKDTGEVFDLVVVGGGISGLSAAYYFHKSAGGAKNCMVLENHAIFGGEARENDFLVDGYHLVGP